jgi:hypothetical protein
MSASLTAGIKIADAHYSMLLQVVAKGLLYGQGNYEGSLENLALT